MNTFNKGDIIKCTYSDGIMPITKGFNYLVEDCLGTIVTLHHDDVMNPSPIYNAMRFVLAVAEAETVEATPADIQHGDELTYEQKNGDKVDCRVIYAGPTMTSIKTAKGIFTVDANRLTKRNV